MSTWAGAETDQLQRMRPSLQDQPLGRELRLLRAQAGQVVQAKVALSFISTEQARRTFAEETPGWHFDEVRPRLDSDQWNSALSKITLKGATASKTTQVYTALYHTMLMPSDRTGENPDWKSDEPYYDDYYAVWDTYRSSGPLLTLIAAGPPARSRALSDRHLSNTPATCPTLAAATTTDAPRVGAMPTWSSPMLG